MTSTTATVSTQPRRLHSNRDVTTAVKAISERRPFVGNSMSGEPNSWVTNADPANRMPYVSSYNRMPDADYRTMMEHAQTVGVDYVIFSWVTPIAYRLTDGSWIVPDVSYSGYTSRHMGLVWSALERMGIDTHIVRPVTVGPRGGIHYGKRNERFYPRTGQTSSAS